MTNSQGSGGEWGPVTRRDIARSAAGGMFASGLMGYAGSSWAAPPAMRAGASGVANVQAFGAIGNGQQDDTESIRAAVAHCGATGSSLYFPAGIYAITGPIAIITRIGFTICGDGYASCIRPRSGGNYIPIFVQGADFSMISGMHLRDFRIDANGTGQLDTGVITFNNVAGSISQMWLENGTRAQGSSGQNGVSCSAGRNGGAEPQVLIINNVIRHFSKAGINFTSGGARAVISCNVISDISGNGTAPGIQINGGRNAIVAHNHIYNIEGTGIYIATDSLGHRSLNANISNNIVQKCGVSSRSQGDGILVTSTDMSDSYIVIEGNQAFGNGTSANGGCGIRIENCDNAVISGNSCHHNTLDGIRVSNSSYIQLAGNRCGGNNVARVEYAGGIQLRGKGKHISITGNHLASREETQSYAIIADADAELSCVTVAANHVTGNALGTIYWQAKGHQLDVEIAVEQRTSGRDPKAVLVWRVDPSSTCWFDVTMTARQIDGQRDGVYLREMAYRLQGSQLIQEESTTARAVPPDHSGWGGVTFASSRDYAVVRVAGDTDSVVAWSGSVRIRSS